MMITSNFKKARMAIFAALAASLALVAGCGGGGGGTPTPLPTPTGTVRMNITWPTREVSKAAESVKASLTVAGTTTVYTLTLNRVAAGAATADFTTAIPVGTHALRLQAYAAAGATGQLIGNGNSTVTVTAGQVSSVSVNSNVMATVASIRLNTPTVIQSGTVQLTPEFLDADGLTLVTSDSTVTWVAATGSVSAANIYTATDTVGTPLVTATHTTTGATGSTNVNVVSNVAYNMTFESQVPGYVPGAEWSKRIRSWVPVPGDPAFLPDVDKPSARGILGLHGSETVTLTLANLPAHTQVRLEFDAVLARFWEGDQSGGFRLNASLGGGGSNFLDATFNNNPLADNTGHTQSFPVANSIPGTGATLFKAQGYVAGFPGSLQVDALYRFRQSVTGYTSDRSHSGSDLVINFTATLPNQDVVGGVDAASNEAWGLEFVKVTLIP